MSKFIQGVSKYILAVFFLVLVNQAMAQQGKLFIIGGGTRSAALIQTLVSTADMGAQDYMIVLPMSSGEPEASYEAIKKQLTAASKNNIGNLNFTAEKVADKKWLDSLANAKLIFITGGDQSRFMKVVLNTPVYTAIHKAYQNGATVAGTSAGAAVMSKQMITGKELLDANYRETFNKLWADNIEFEEGLGLLQSVIIDQHFLKRSRYNRLISALAAFPKFQCIGIDEGTAIIVQGKKITVAGVSQVLSLSRPKNIKVSAKHLIAMEDLRFSLYTAGDQFNLK